jgi:hypothetical protein
MDRHELVAKAIRQYQEGLLTYGDLMEAIVRAGRVPCPCLGCIDE